MTNPDVGVGVGTGVSVGCKVFVIATGSWVEVSVGEGRRSAVEVTSLDGGTIGDACAVAVGGDEAAYEHADRNRETIMKLNRKIFIFPPPASGD
jgi:hypothetical protein